MAQSARRQLPWYAHVILLGPLLIYGLSLVLPGLLGCSEYRTAQSALCTDLEAVLDVDVLWVAGRVGLFAMILSIVTVPLAVIVYASVLVKRRAPDGA